MVRFLEGFGRSSELLSVLVSFTAYVAPQFSMGCLLSRAKRSVRFCPVITPSRLSVWNDFKGPPLTPHPSLCRRVIAGTRAVGAEPALMLFAVM